MTYKKLTQIKPNPDNPRVIRDENFKKLVNSIKEFPEMLDLRPIVVNKDMVILGGNMRYRACQEAGYKEVPVVIADNITKEQEREFIIKDNISGGDWDWDALANEWDNDSINDWGLEVPSWNPNEEEIDLSTLEDTMDTFLNNTIRQIVLYYDTEEHKSVLQRLETVSTDLGLDHDNSTVVLKLLEHYEKNRSTKKGS